MASTLGIVKSSALAENVKSNTITQETIRRLSNTGRDVTQTVRNNVLDTYVRVLLKSGYSMNDIRNSMIPGIVGYERRVVREENGGVPVHRTGDTIRKSTGAKKINLSSNWFKAKPKGEVYKVKRWGNRKVPSADKGCTEIIPSAPLFVQRSPGGTLSKLLSKCENDLNKQGTRKVKICEDGGTNCV